MIKIENTKVMGWAIRGMRNPMNSWDKSDSGYCKGCNNVLCASCNFDGEEGCLTDDNVFIVGPNDLSLMKKLAAAGPVHAKYRRMITVYCDITAPLYWWKEFDTYKVGTVANSCSTMHKIADKEFTLDDFSYEHLSKTSLLYMDNLIEHLNFVRDVFNSDKTNKGAWWQMIQLLPSSYNQKRTVMLNYEVLSHIYHDRKNHKLDEWCRHDVHDTPGTKTSGLTFSFCDWIETLPYSELITGEKGEGLSWLEQ